jgi:DNA-binding HxlR family transcriptional regulator
MSIMKNNIECPAERAIYFLGGKWKIRILFYLFNNKIVRFNKLKKELKTITQQMLSKQLKELEIDGIINRKVHQVVPPKVEYSLTDFGLSVIPILKSFSDWNKKNIKTISLKLNKNFEESRIR